MLMRHRLTFIVGEEVQICNYPFNYSAQCFHYLFAQHSARKITPAAAPVQTALRRASTLDAVPTQTTKRYSRYVSA